MLRFHRDERGDALEYLLVVGVISIPAFVTFLYLGSILQQWYSQLAFFVGWPFL